jgi:methylated-DNA-[protein]-cysteine S-methyltransferase
MDSPIGPLTLVADDGALTAVGMDAPVPDRSWRCDRTEVAAAADQLDGYFSGDLRQFDLSLRPAGTSFQQAVWAELRRIPFGEVVSYGEIARRMGRPGAFRAVGAANGRNPLAVVVPCHRVIGADGSLTGYGGGIWRKRWLLAHEGVGACL